jgi:hypothetical protein
MSRLAHSASNLCRSRREVFLDSSLKSLGVRADNLSYLVAVLEQQKGRHGADTEFLSDIGDLIDVDLVEAGGGVGVGEPLLRN